MAAAQQVAGSLFFAPVAFKISWEIAPNNKPKKQIKEPKIKGTVQKEKVELKSNVFSRYRKRDRKQREGERGIKQAKVLYLYKKKKAKQLHSLSSV